MDIGSIGHRGLRRLVESGDASGLPSMHVNKIGRVLSFLQDMPDASALRTVSSWRLHMLGGNRKGTHALHVSPNWRLTFRIDATAGALADLDFEDYH